MRKTDSIKIQSLPKEEVRLTCLTLVESVNLMQERSSYFGFIKLVLLKISNLDNVQVENMTIQDAIALIVYYRMYFWDDEIITESPALCPSDFIGGYDDEIKRDELFIRIGDYRFTPFITVKKAIEAELFCQSSGDIKNLRFYILGSGCTKTIKDGVDTIMSLMANSKDIGLLKQYDSLVGELSNITLTLTHDSGKISIISENGGEPIALPFQGSLLLSFGL